MKTALIILAEGFEEIEAVCPIDLLRRAGVETTVASLDEDRRVTGKTGLRVEADAALSEVLPKDFDLVVLPGGPGVARMRKDPRLPPLLRKQAEAGRVIGAICAAPLVLLDAGLLPGARHTAHPSTAGELPEAESGSAVVVAGNLVTSRGAGTAVEFGLVLVARMAGEETAMEIRRSICADTGGSPVFP